MTDYTITLRGDVFVVAPLPALDAFAMQPRLAPAIVEVLVAFAEIVQGEFKRLAEKAAAEAAEMGAAAESDDPLKALDPAALVVAKRLSMDDVSELAGKLDLAEVDTSQIAPVVARFCAALPAGELLKVTRDLLNGATVNGAPLFGPGGGVFAAKMQGRTIDTWRLLFFALKVNFPDFFVAFAAKDGGTSQGAPSGG